MKCPTHKSILIPQQTRFGLRFSCPEPGCDVVAWNGSTSTPADAETRQLRHRCHELFDPLWREGRMTRRAAYAHLRGLMKLPKERCHIGMFDKEQCLKLIALLEVKGESP